MTGSQRSDCRKGNSAITQLQNFAFLAMTAQTRRLLFLICAILCLTPWVGPPAALALGLVFGLTLGNPFRLETKKASRVLLQASVVALGFGMNLNQVVRAGRSGFVYTAVGIAFALALGNLLGRV